MRAQRDRASQPEQTGEKAERKGFPAEGQAGIGGVVSAEVSERHGCAACRLTGLGESFRSHHARERLSQTIRDGGTERSGRASRWSGSLAALQGSGVEATRIGGVRPEMQPMCR